MPHPNVIRRVVALVLLCAAVLPVAAQQREEFTNLKVLPKDVSPQELRATMNGFTRALGVRCLYCHVGEEGKPFRHEDFAKDDKPTKRKARDMMRMMNDINQNYLAHLEARVTPTLNVQCVTCHHGVPQPRTLQDVLQQSYDTGGIDSTLARYQALRDKYYGRFSYDFGDVPLADLGGHLAAAGHQADAQRLLALNVDMNPKSNFAKRQHALVAIESAFSTSGADSGVAVYHRYAEQYGAPVNEEVVNQIGYDLLGAGKADAAIAAFKLNTTEHPQSVNTWDSLGEAYLQNGDTKNATAAYKKVLELDPANEHAKQALDDLKAKGGKGKAPKKK